MWYVEKPLYIENLHMMRYIRLPLILLYLCTTVTLPYSTGILLTNSILSDE